MNSQVDRDTLPTIAPKIGGNYRMRNGEETGVIDRKQSTLTMDAYPFHSAKEGRSFTPSGAYHAAGYSREFDIVEIISEPPAFQSTQPTNTMSKTFDTKRAYQVLIGDKNIDISKAIQQRAFDNEIRWSDGTKSLKGEYVGRLYWKNRSDLAHSREQYTEPEYQELSIPDFLALLDQIGEEKRKPKLTFGGRDVEIIQPEGMGSTKKIKVAGHEITKQQVFNLVKWLKERPTIVGYSVGTTIDGKVQVGCQTGTVDEIFAVVKEMGIQ